jgi:peptidyl-prolyl cis-trans isomerase D
VEEAPAPASAEAPDDTSGAEPGNDAEAEQTAGAPDAAQGTLASLGLTARSETAKRRDSLVQGAPPALVERAFELDAGEAALVQTGGAVYLLRVTDVAPAELSAEDGDIAGLRRAVEQQVEQGLAQDILQLYTQSVMQAAEVELNQAAINAVHAQFP